MIVTKRESMASLIHDTCPTLRHSLQLSHNKGLYYGFRDAILSRLVKKFALRYIRYIIIKYGNYHGRLIGKALNGLHSVMYCWGR